MLTAWRRQPQPKWRDVQRSVMPTPARGRSHPFAEGRAGLEDLLLRHGLVLVVLGKVAQRRHLADGLVVHGPGSRLLGRGVLLVVGCHGMPLWSRSDVRRPRSGRPRTSV